MVKGANELHANPVDAASANGVGIRPAKRSPVGFIGLGRMGTVMHRHGGKPLRRRI